MITIETFFMLSAAVVLIGLIVWRRDLKSGRILRPKSLTRARSVRDLFADTRSPSMSPPPPDADAARRRTTRGEGDRRRHPRREGRTGLTLAGPPV